MLSDVRRIIRWRLAMKLIGWAHALIHSDTDIDVKVQEAFAALNDARDRVHKEILARNDTSVGRL